MKRIALSLLAMAAAVTIYGASLRPTDQITAIARTIYNNGEVAQPDSLRLHVFRNGSELFDAWYDTADIECSAVDGWLLFTDQLQDIDGAGGDGHYVILARAYDADSSLYTPCDIQHHDVGPWEEIDGLAGWDPSTESILADSASVARSVWNTPQANHTAVGTFGKYLDTEVSGIGGGTGAYSVTLMAYDSASAQTVSRVHLAVRNKDQSSLLASVSTAAGGTAAVNLDADSFVVVAAAPGYLFTPYDTIVVTGAGVDTIYGYHIDPGTPASPSLCRVYGYLYTVTGQPEQDAVISAHLPKGVTRTDNLIVSPFAVSNSTDSTGYFYLDLIPSDSLLGDAVKYVITISRTDGSVLRKKITVPAAGSWQLAW